MLTASLNKPQISRLDGAKAGLDVVTKKIATVLMGN
jgi:hypothetical protein